ncbi:MAG: hypothetical protein WCZ66_03270 [Sphingomonadaceae bacterium]
MHQVNVTGLTRNSRLTPNKSGNVILAYFDCEANGLELAGCAFVRTPRHGLTVWAPKLETPGGARRSVTIADSQLRSAMVRQAQAAYRALGGTDGDWGPRESESDKGDNGNDDDGEGLRRFITGAS